jgi:hypothetical protein
MGGLGALPVFRARGLRLACLCLSLPPGGIQLIFGRVACLTFAVSPIACSFCCHSCMSPRAFWLYVSLSAVQLLPVAIWICVPEGFD